MKHIIQCPLNFCSGAQLEQSRRKTVKSTLTTFCIRWKAFGIYSTHERVTKLPIDPKRWPKEGISFVIFLKFLSKLDHVNLRLMNAHIELQERLSLKRCFYEEIYFFPCCIKIFHFHLTLPLISSWRSEYIEWGTLNKQMFP